MNSKIKIASNYPPLMPVYPHPNNHRRPYQASSSQITKAPSSMVSPLSHSPSTTRRKPTSILCSQTQNTHNQDLAHYWNGLKFIRGEKLLSDLSSWGIGGPCNYFVQVHNLSQLSSAIRYCKEHSIGFMIIGKGSNCLFDDLGFDGCVILNGIEFLERRKIEYGGLLYRVGSGFGFNRLGLQSCSEGFTGLEFAGGIPGTVGGAVFMNAGANGQETGDVIDSVEIITTEGKIHTLNRTDLVFGYRSSPFQDMENLAAIVAVTFRLKQSKSARQKQQEYLERRRATQPVRERTAGSVFQNPRDLGVSAGELIEKAGLKGHRVGGAMVSTIHANFFINSGGSTSRDMMELIRVVKETVREKFGVQLKEEVLYVHPNTN